MTRAAAALLLALSLLGPHAAGCSGSRPATLLTGASGDALAVNSAALLVDTPASLAIQATLALIDPTFPPVVLATVRSSGGPTNGSVDLDFGSPSSNGAKVSGVVMRGVVNAAWVRNGSQVTITITFPSLTASNDYLVSTTFGGTVTWSGTLGAAGSASGPLTGQASLVAAEGIVYTANETVSFTTSGATTTYTVSGTATSVHSVRGSWSLSFSNLQAQLMPSQFVFPGSLALVQQNTTLTASIVFTSPDQGTITIGTFSSEPFDLR